jgi:hypothetical protein
MFFQPFFPALKCGMQFGIIYHAVKSWVDPFALGLNHKKHLCLSQMSCTFSAQKLLWQAVVVVNKHQRHNLE